jgi:N-acetylmuramoyl-L-alanine amidase
MFLVLSTDSYGIVTIATLNFMHDENVHIKLTSRHIAFIIGLFVGLLFWGAQTAFGSTTDLGATPLDHVLAATGSATRALTASSSAASTIAPVEQYVPEPAPSPIQAAPIANLRPHNFTVGLQVGHMNNQNPPTELRWISRNTGSSGAGTTEPAVAYTIAMETKRLLEQHGVQVDIIPAVVTPGYQADAFISIHTDGSEKSHISGYKGAPSSYDRSGKAAQLNAAVEQSYAAATNMRKDEKITENMTHYYSFASSRVSHSISPYTPGILFETGFLTSPEDQEILVRNPEKSAQGLAGGIIAYLESQR